MGFYLNKGIYVVLSYTYLQKFLSNILLGEYPIFIHVPYKSGQKFGVRIDGIEFGDSVGTLLDKVSAVIGIPSCRIQVGTREVRSAELRRPIAHYKQLYELYRPYYSYQAYIRTDDQEPFRHCK